MASIDEFSTAITAAADSIEAVIAAIGAAKETGEELSSQVAGLGMTTKANETHAVAQRLETEAATQAAQLKDLLDEIRQQAAALAGLKGTPSAGASSGSGSSAQPARPRPTPPLIQDLGDRLPAGGRGVPTRLFAYSDDSNPVEFTSGRDSAAKVGLKRPYQRLIIMDHAEAKLAAEIRTSRISGRVSAVINNEPCPGPRGCDAIFSDLLPPGVTVELYVSTADGTRYYGEFEGNGKAIQ